MMEETFNQLFSAYAVEDDIFFSERLFCKAFLLLLYSQVQTGDID